MPGASSALSSARVRVPLVTLIVVGLIFGTASLASGQSGQVDGPAKPTLGSEPVINDVALSPETIAVLEQIEPVDDIDPSELLDDLATQIDVVEAPPAGPEAADLDGSQPRPGVVHLTFDDGPHPEHTPAILDVLARHDAKATFFVLGSLIEENPELFQRIVNEGHTVANHSWKHQDLTTLTREEFNDSITRTQTALGPHATKCLRPPYGAMNANTRAWAASTAS